jgi:hypothetical protein
LIFLYISYERLSSSGKLGFEIPLNYYTNGMGYSTGFNLKYYFSGRGRGFYIGPSISVGSFEGVMYEPYYDEYYGNGFAIMAGAKLGGQIQISKLVGINISTTGGYFQPFGSNAMEGSFQYSLNLGVNFSF